MGKQRKTMKRVKISRKTLSGLNLTTFLVLTIFSGNFVYANSPFVNVPLYLSKIEQINTKSNLMLFIDDSGSMVWYQADELNGPQNGPARPKPGNRMDQAITSAVSIVSDPVFQKQFNFGVAHLRTTDYRIKYGNYYDKWNVSEDGVRTNLNTVMVPIGDPENSTHFNNLINEIQRLRPFDGTTI